MMQVLGLRSGFDPPDLDRPGSLRLPHQQGLCEAARGSLKSPFSSIYVCLLLEDLVQSCVR